VTPLAQIVGSGQAPYERHPPAETTTPAVLARAAREAIENAGLKAGDIDGLAVSSFTLKPDHGIDFAWRFGLKLSWLMEETNGGAGGVNMLRHAARAVQAGDARAILLLAGDHLPPAAFTDLVENYNRATADHLAPLPFGGPNSLFALLTQRHAAANGLTREDYGALVTAQRGWAAGNPNAAYRSPLTVEEYLEAKIVADPLCIYDCVPVVTGADAIVVCAADDQTKTRGPRVDVRAVSLSFNADDQAGDGLSTGVADQVAELWKNAGAGPQDMDLVSVYDDYPAMVLVQLADLGFAPDGDIRALIHDRIATRELPVNTSGGQLSAGQAGAAGGLHGLVEVVRQLRGEAEGRQVRDARRAVVGGYGMVLYRYGAASGAAVLERAGANT
jgi:acetyl-CoA acetyltransferase